MVLQVAAFDSLSHFRYIYFMAWTVFALNRAVEDEIAGLPPDMRARLTRLAALVEQHGFEALPREAVKHLEERLWELRIKGRDGISRAIYLTASGKRMVIVRVFIKKTRKTPKGELEIARQRAKEVR